MTLDSRTIPARFPRTPYLGLKYAVMTSLLVRGKRSHLHLGKSGAFFWAVGNRI